MVKRDYAVIRNQEVVSLCPVIAIMLCTLGKALYLSCSPGGGHSIASVVHMCDVDQKCKKGLFS